jgi:hypothetical protein
MPAIPRARDTTTQFPPSPTPIALLRETGQQDQDGENLIICMSAPEVRSLLALPNKAVCRITIDCGVGMFRKFRQYRTRLYCPPATCRQGQLTTWHALVQTTSYSAVLVAVA